MVELAAMKTSAFDPKRTQVKERIAMTGVGGTSPKTRSEKIAWWTAFAAFFAFVVYVLVKNFF